MNELPMALRQDGLREKRRRPWLILASRGLAQRLLGHPREYARYFTEMPGFCRIVYA
ncbi:MAG TPA: hypothetical protein VHB01_07460 [Nitrosospira sp.]|nr:hypothetical protein [Nitrosospira sp.]